MQNFVLKEYAGILEKYMKKFGLESIDIAFLAKSNKKTIDAVLARTGGIELVTQEAISQAFGLRHFQFGNPDFPISSFDSLPESTKERIAFRKKHGPHETTSYNQRLLNEKISMVLPDYKIGAEFLAEHIAAALQETFKEEFSTSEVGKRLTNSLTEYVIKTDKQEANKKGRGPKPYYFRLIKKIPAKVLKEAKEKIGVTLL